MRREWGNPIREEGRGNPIREWGNPIREEGMGKPYKGMGEPYKGINNIREYKGKNNRAWVSATSPVVTAIQRAGGERGVVG